LPTGATAFAYLPGETKKHCIFAIYCFKVSQGYVRFSIFPGDICSPQSPVKLTDDSIGTKFEMQGHEAEGGDEDESN